MSMGDWPTTWDHEGIFWLVIFNSLKLNLVFIRYSWTKWPYSFTARYKWTRRFRRSTSAASETIQTSSKSSSPTVRSLSLASRSRQTSSKKSTISSKYIFCKTSIPVRKITLLNKWPNRSLLLVISSTFFVAVLVLLQIKKKRLNQPPIKQMQIINLLFKERKLNSKIRFKTVRLNWANKSPESLHQARFKRPLVKL